jgi:hypothetical protein
MNPLLIETSMRTALAASAFTGTQINLGSDYTELTPESLNLIVSCASVDHTAGGLHKAELTVKITAPSLLGSDSMATFVSTINSLRAALTPGYLGANWPTGDSFQPAFGGIWVSGTKTSQEDHAWVAEIACILGVSE